MKTADQYLSKTFAMWGYCRDAGQPPVVAVAAATETQETIAAELRAGQQLDVVVAVAACCPALIPWY